MVLLVRKYRRLSGEAIQELIDNLVELKKKQYKLSKSFQSKNKEKTNAEKADMASQQWNMIRVVQRQLLLYGLVDFTIQILFQMPLVTTQLQRLKLFGFKKIWTFTGDVHLGQLTYKEYIGS